MVLAWTQPCRPRSSSAIPGTFRPTWSGTPRSIPSPSGLPRAPSWTGLPGGGLNIAHEAVDRHAAGPCARRVALRFVGARRHAPRSSPTPISRAQTNRFANVLRGLGVAPGERVFSLAGRIPELYVAVLGTLKARQRLLRRCSRRSGPNRSGTRLELGQAPGAGHHRRRSTAARSQPLRPPLPAPRARPARRRRRREPPSRGHARPRRAAGARRADEFAIAPTEPGRPGAAALHQRHDRHAQGRRARARGRRRPPRDRPARARPAPRRRLLVHRRPGLGHRHLLRHHRPAHARRDERRRRGRSSTPSAGTRSLARRSRSPSGTRRRRRSAC